MTPSAFQVPPRPLGAGASVCGVPPPPEPTSSRLSVPSATKPTARLSGAQKGKVAPSVPASGCAVALDLTLVTHNRSEFERVPGLRLAEWKR